MRHKKIAKNSQGCKKIIQFFCFINFYLIFQLLIFSTPIHAKYASIVIDADTGRVLHQTNSDTRNYPASLTKMMTLYVIFDTVKSGKLRLNSKLKVSYRAARQPASRLGLKYGQSITVHQAILALVTKSANDVATIVSEHIAKSERAFALKMTATARKLGMSRTTFRNASGLPHRGQLSTARDMAKLAAALIKDHPNFYHYFSVKKFRFNGEKYKNHNKLLTTYDGVDGIKTGYIRASGYNLVASVKRKNKRIIGVIFGGNSSRHRNRHMTKLLNKGFRVATKNVRQAANVASNFKSPKVKKAKNVQNAWGVQVGAFYRRSQAIKAAKNAKKTVRNILKSGTIKIVSSKRSNGQKLYKARINGITKKNAHRACVFLKKKRHHCMELIVKPPLQVASR